MQKTLFYPAAHVLAAYLLAGCANGLPACDAAAASNAVSRMLAAQVSNRTGILQNDLMKRVRFVLERPQAVEPGTPGQPRTCHAVATYTVSDALLEKLRRSERDPAYHDQGWRNWRLLLGLNSAADLRLRVDALVHAATESEEHVLRDELAKILNVDEHFDAQALPAEIAYYLNGPARNRDADIGKQVALLTHALEARDKTSNKITLAVQYTISASAADRQFQVLATTNDNLIKGIKLLEVLQSALIE